MANKITVTSAGTVANANVTPDTAMYYSNKSKDWAISDRIVDNTDYSSKHYANESKKQADISTAKTTEVIESGNTALTNIDMARNNAILDITNQENLSVDNVNTAGATQVSSVNTAGITQVANVNSAGTTQINLAKEQVTLATNQANIATEQATIATNKASEVVESGNTALANIDTAKNNAITSITNQETTSKNNVIATGNEQVARIEATGNNYDNLTHKNITNCLLEVPQRIKLELNDGILTLKAGSQVIVPNGFEADGTTPKFDYVNVESDLNLANGTATEEVFFVVVASGKNLFRYTKSAVFSGSVAPTVSTQYACWYDTANNVLKQTINTGATWKQANWGLPIGVGTTTTTSVTSINQVFNGMGYIGSTVWVDKGVKGLIPNGRNADGSLNNIEYVTQNLRTRTLPDNSSIEIAIRSGGSLTVYAYFTMSDENYLIGNNGDKVIGVSIASVYMKNNVITSFTPKLPFRAVDYNDKAEISGWGMPSNKYIDLTLGANGSTYTAPANGYFQLAVLSGESIQFYNKTKASFWKASVSGGGAFAESIECQEGDIIQCYYKYTTFRWFRFYYAEGSKGE